MGEVKPKIETLAAIKVVGVGGSGSSAVNWMVESKKIRGVDFVTVNTDAQALYHSLAPIKLHIGKVSTKGLGAGMDPEQGKKSAEENQNELRDLLKGSDMVFITCGLGGGTGTGASPVIAQIAKDLGALTVAVVTKPFSFEGAQRKLIADQGLQELQQRVDAIIVIPNDRVLQIIDKKTPLLDAFATVNDVLRQGVQGISDLITVHGLTNVDFADVRAVMRDAGSALMVIGEGKGESRAVDAAKRAISSPLLEVSIDGARGILFTITGGKDLTMNEVAEAAKVITTTADQQAKIIYGVVIDPEMKDAVKVTVVATGFPSARAPEAPALKESSYTPPPFLSKPKRVIIDEPKAPQVQMTAPQYTPATSSAAPVVRREERKIIPPPQIKGDDELDIPAFIRKKML